MPQYSSLRELYVTRLREFYRQPARIFWVYGFPTILAVLLGLAFRGRPPETITATIVSPHSPGEPTTGRYGLRIPGTASLPGVHLESRPWAEALHRLKTGHTPLVVEPLPGGARGSPERVRYHFDPTRPEAVTARVIVDAALQRARGRADAFAVHDLAVTEPGSRYIDFLIPGLIGLNTMGGGLWGIGFLLVNFRIAKLLKRFMATPMPRRNFLLAILGARMTFLIPDVGVLLLMGVWMFRMPIRGSLVTLGLIEVAGALAFAGIGLLVASRAKTTETVSGLMNLVMLPQWLFSGVFFASDRFPPLFQPFISALPLTQLNVGLRLVILEGAGLSDGRILTALVVLSAWAVVTFVLALRFFRWT